MIMGDRHWALHNILSSFHKNIYSEFSDPVDTDKTDEIIAPTMHCILTVARFPYQKYRYLDLF
jgi:hypothetical protein